MLLLFIFVTYLAINKQKLDLQKHLSIKQKSLKTTNKHGLKIAMELSVAYTTRWSHWCAFDCAGLYVFLVTECKVVIIVCDGLKQDIEEQIMGDCMIWQDSEWVICTLYEA